MALNRLSRFPVADHEFINQNLEQLRIRFLLESARNEEAYGKSGGGGVDERPEQQVD